MALERANAGIEGCEKKLTQIERRMMESRMVGYEFVKCWMTCLSAEVNETHLRLSLGVLIATFFQARESLSRQKKYELLRFYMSVAVLRFYLLDSEGEERLRLHRLDVWEHETFEDYKEWPWGEEIFTCKA